MVKGMCGVNILKREIVVCVNFFVLFSILVFIVFYFVFGRCLLKELG